MLAVTSYRQPELSLLSQETKEYASMTFLRVISLQDKQYEHKPYFGYPSIYPYGFPLFPQVPKGAHTPHNWSPIAFGSLDFLEKITRARSATR